MRTTTALILGVALLLSVAQAACPNQCSGHGRCNEVDRCVCFRSTGNRAGYREAWTGFDCSQRICPFGKSHDTIRTQDQALAAPVGELFATRSPGNTAPLGLFQAFITNGLQVKFDLNVDVEIIKYTDRALGLGDGQLRFKRDVDTVWSAPIDFDTRSGQTYTMAGQAQAYEIKIKVNNVEKNTGAFVFFDATKITASTEAPMVGDHFFFNVSYNDGNRYFAADDNTAHPNIECSGRGNCDRTSGMCQCFSGFVGAACERTTCPNECSGHGVCQAIKRFAPSATPYTLAFDATQQYGCRCDKGFRGGDCSEMECPSGRDPMGGHGSESGRDCSGRGTCDYSTGQCRCASGYFGERCESRTTFV